MNAATRLEDDRCQHINECPDADHWSGNKLWTPRAVGAGTDAVASGYEQSARRCCLVTMQERRGLRFPAGGQLDLVHLGRLMLGLRDARKQVEAGVA